MFFGRFPACEREPVLFRTAERNTTGREREKRSGGKVWVSAGTRVKAVVMSRCQTSVRLSSRQLSCQDVCGCPTPRARASLFSRKSQGNHGCHWLLCFNSCMLFFFSGIVFNYILTESQNNPSLNVLNKLQDR